MFRSHSSIFALEKQAKNLNFQSFFTSNRPLVATFGETRAPTSRKYVAGQGILIPNFLVALFHFYFRKTTKKSTLLESFYL